MNVKLLRRLRKEAHKQIKIRYNIDNTYSIINAYYDHRYHFDTDTYSIKEAKQKLIIARRVFIENQIELLRAIKRKKLVKEITKQLSRY